MVGGVFAFEGLCIAGTDRTTTTTATAAAAAAAATTAATTTAANAVSLS